jgi:hypothetical protein
VFGRQQGDHPAIVTRRGRNDGDVRRVSRARSTGDTGPGDEQRHDAMPDEAVSHSL